MTSEAMPPLVSIVVPVYNAETYLARTLASVQAQTLSEWELVAIDDGSKDGSADIVRAFAADDNRIRLVQQANGGVAAARNRGYAETNPASSYIIFLDNDDLWEPDLLAKLRRALEAAPHCAASHGRATFIDAQDKPHAPETYTKYLAVMEEVLTARALVADNKIVDNPSSETTTFQHFAVCNCIVSPGCVLFRRTALPSGVLFDAQAAPCDDWDLYLSLTRRQSFVYVPDAAFYYRVHATNASHNTDLMWRSNDYVLRKSYNAPENTPEQSAILVVGMRGPYRRKIRERQGWMQESLRRGKILPATQQVWQILKLYREIQRVPQQMKSKNFSQ